MSVGKTDECIEDEQDADAKDDPDALRQQERPDHVGPARHGLVDTGEPRIDAIEASVQLVMTGQALVGLDLRLTGSGSKLLLRSRGTATSPFRPFSTLFVLPFRRRA